MATPAVCPSTSARTAMTGRSTSTGSRGCPGRAVACHRCGFGFLFELMDDYYPGPNTGLVVCYEEGRILASGRGVFELIGYSEGELMGQPVVDRARARRIRERQEPGLARARVGRPADGRAARTADEGRRCKAGDRGSVPGVRRGRRSPRRAQPAALTPFTKRLNFDPGSSSSKPALRSARMDASLLVSVWGRTRGDLWPGPATICVTATIASVA